MQDQKLNPITVAVFAVIAITIFLPAFVFDFLFPAIRTDQLQYDDWQMWQFWVECAQNDHLGIPIWQAFAEWSDKLKLGLWMVTTVATPVAGLGGVMLWKRNRDLQITTGQTSAVFAKLDELKEYQGKDGEGLILSKNVRMRQNTCFTHLLVVGPTGSGKTQSFFLPNIMKLDPSYSLVITDPKGELYQKTAAHQRSLGREPVLLKLDNAGVSVFWNPLDVPKDSVMMSKVCTSIVKNRGGGAGGGDQEMWDSMAVNLLTAMAYIVKALPAASDLDSHPYGNLKNVSDMLSQCTFECFQGLAKFAVAELGVRNIISRIATFSDSVSPEDTRNSARAVLQPSLAPFLIDDVACITATTDFDFCDLKRKPIALYVSVPEHKVTGLAPVLSTLYMQIFDSLLEMGEGGRPVFFLMDEFANIGKVIGFPQYVATIRSRNLSVSVCLQSAEQLTRNYSDPEKQEILNNLKVNVVLPGLKEEKTLQYLQTVGGKVSELVKASAKEDERAITKDRLPINEIREMQDNYDSGVHETIVIFPNKPAYKDRQRRSYSDPEVKALLDKCGKVDFPQRDPSVLANVQDTCFFDQKDFEFLDILGTYLAYNGCIKKIPDDKKLAALKKFEDLNHLCGGLPAVTEQGISWSVTENLSQNGKVARHIITKTFRWAIAEGILRPEDVKR